jgi:hypothetical protein
MQCCISFLFFRLQKRDQKQKRNTHSFHNAPPTLFFDLKRLQIPFFYVSLHSKREVAQKYPMVRSFYH